MAVIDQHTAETMLTDMEKRWSKLTEWEQKFTRETLAKVRSHLAAGTRCWLSNKQKEVIDKTWTRITSERD